MSKKANKSKPLGLAGLALSVLAACWAHSPLLADSSVYESEPNNTPAEANPLRGAVTVLGTMDGGDQDGFIWTVSDEDAQKRWVFELNGIPGRLTIAEVVRVEFAEDGIQVASKQRLMKMGTRDGYTPSITRDLVFEPGEYLIGIAYAGGSPSEGQGGGAFRPPAAGLSFGDSGEPEVTSETPMTPDPEPGAYRFVIREGARLQVQAEPKTGAGREEATSVRQGREFANFESRAAAWYALEFKPGDDAQRWDIRVQVPVGRAADATLFDAAGQQLDKKRNGERGHVEFPGIVPQEQPFYLLLEPLEPGFLTAVGSEAVGQRVAGEEAEPNGEWELANRVDLSQPLIARVNEANESDYFRFTVDEAQSEQLLRLLLESEPAGQKLRFCLHDSRGESRQCRDAQTPIELPDLLLSPGDWGLSVIRAKTEFEYRVTLAAQGAIEPGREVEPNDEIEIASSVPPNNRIKGRASGKEDDYFRLLVAEEPQLWRFQVIGEGVEEIAYYDGAGKQVANWRPKGKETRLRLDNLYLLPGKHYLRVSGRDGAEYTVLARPQGPPDPNGEREPNDDTSRMQRLAVGQTRTGLLADENDRDYYRFFLGNWDHVRLTIKPPADGLVEASINWYESELADGASSGPGEAMVLEGLFPPGDYHVGLEARQPSDAEYFISLERLPRFSCPADCEPNGMKKVWLAAPVPPSLVLEGDSKWWRDSDVYRLPTLDAPSELLIRTAEPAARVLAGARYTSLEALDYDAEAGGYRTTVPAGTPQLLEIVSREKPYRMELVFEPGPEPLESPELPVSLELELDHQNVSAYRVFGQRVGGRLSLANESAMPRNIVLETATSDYRWQARLERSGIELAANSRAEVALDVRVPPDAWADRPVRISVRAHDAAGAQSETWAEIGVERDLAPVAPAWEWSVPESLRGGLNAAWLPFGAEWTGDVPRGAESEVLRDGMVFGGRRIECCGQTYGWTDERPQLTLKLPGDQPRPVAGIAINHFGVPWPLRNLRKGSLSISEDGIDFEKVLEFETLPVLTEQYFALAAPRMARFVRLRLEETFEQASGAGGVTMGEWKVILEPGHDLSGGQGFNLADPALGGHLVWDSPPQSYSPVTILEPDRPSNEVRARPDANVEYVIGFQDNRAAQIRGVDWTWFDAIKPVHALEKVLVSVSTESPVGPWEPVGEFVPGVAAGTVELNLETPVWARFVRLTGVRSGESGVTAAPDQVRIWERPSGPEYFSALGEWGLNSPLGYYEQLRGLPQQPTLDAGTHWTREAAASLSAGETATGQVALDKHLHWYRLRVPSDANTLAITLAGQPTVRTVLALESAAGEPLPLRPLEHASDPMNHRFEAFVEPGAEVYLQVAEPPRNVVFSWDTSASVVSHLPVIYNSLSAFVSQVVPGQESANFVPFGRGALLDTWLGEPYMLQTVLNDYPRSESSSAGESALQVSAQTLAPVPGSKAVVIISDGAVVHHGPMWKEMREIQPRVFGVGVGGYEPQHIDVFQDWAAVNGGNYRQLNYQGEMEIAFDRAATLMRRPADYTLRVETEYREAPGPGLLRVVSGEGDGGSRVSAGAVQLILDASGSMLQRMEGKRRIVIAKEVLTEAVREHIPAETPVALRVFGHKEPGTCATELLLPLGPLNPDRAAAAIEQVQARNLAKTPIADSLAAVPSDLGGAKAAAVILVTDGEETCDGDPARVIESLAEQGIDVTLNIVGFAIDDAALEAQFAEWAELGNGRYLSASNQQALRSAIEDALRVPFEVQDNAGEVVAVGLLDGEAVTLDQGYYRIVVRTSPPQVFENVEVVGGSDQTLDLTR